MIYGHNTYFEQELRVGGFVGRELREEVLFAQAAHSGAGVPQVLVVVVMVLSSSGGLGLCLLGHHGDHFEQTERGGIHVQKDKDKSDKEIEEDRLSDEFIGVKEVTLLFLMHLTDLSSF
jgi:hypothetical protein